METGRQFLLIALLWAGVQNCSLAKNLPYCPEFFQEEYVDIELGEAAIPEAISEHLCYFRQGSRLFVRLPINHPLLELAITDYLASPLLIYGAEEQPYSLELPVADSEGSFVSGYLDSGTGSTESESVWWQLGFQDWPEVIETVGGSCAYSEKGNKLICTLDSDARFMTVTTSKPPLPPVTQTQQEADTDDHDSPDDSSGSSGAGVRFDWQRVPKLQTEITARDFSDVMQSLMPASSGKFLASGAFGAETLDWLLSWGGYSKTDNLVQKTLLMVYPSYPRTNTDKDNIEEAALAEFREKGEQGAREYLRSMGCNDRELRDCMARVREIVQREQREQSPQEPENEEPSGASNTPSAYSGYDVEEAAWGQFLEYGSAGAEPLLKWAQYSQSDIAEIIEDFQRREEAQKKLLELQDSMPRDAFYYPQVSGYSLRGNGNPGRGGVGPMRGHVNHPPVAYSPYHIGGKGSRQNDVPQASGGAGSNLYQPGTFGNPGHTRGVSTNFPVSGGLLGAGALEPPFGNLPNTSLQEGPVLTIEDSDLDILHELYESLHVPMPSGLAMRIAFDTRLSHLSSRAREYAEWYFRKYRKEK